jgi:hypothetical protein
MRVLLSFDITDEGTFLGDTFCFDSFISRSIEYIEIVPGLKGLFLQKLWSFY